jgi:hypothetical protein
MSFPDTEEVTGSIPVSPTTFLQVRGSESDIDSEPLLHLRTICEQENRQPARRARRSRRRWVGVNPPNTPLVQERSPGPNSKQQRDGGAAHTHLHRLRLPPLIEEQLRRPSRRSSPRRPTQLGPLHPRQTQRTRGGHRRLPRIRQRQAPLLRVPLRQHLTHRPEVGRPRGGLSSQASARSANDRPPTTRPATRATRRATNNA